MFCKRYTGPKRRTNQPKHQQPQKQKWEQNTTLKIKSHPNVSAAQSCMFCYLHILYKANMQIHWELPTYAINVSELHLTMGKGLDNCQNFPFYFSNCAEKVDDRVP